MRHRVQWTAFAGLLLVVILGRDAKAQVSYSVIDSIYTQNFDTLPNTPENASLGASPLGWIDDNSSPNVGNFSILGWYLYHPVTQSEGGANNHQRMRAGSGTSSTGAFYSYGESGSTERALASTGSTTMASASQSMYMAMRLVNNTSETISGFELTYDGEQWRVGGTETGNDKLLFAYSLTADVNNWNTASGFTAVPSLTFTPPVTGVAAAAVDGNGIGRVSDIHGATAGFSWLPGTELWLRWAGLGGAGAVNNGLGIDNIRFTAGNNIVDPTLITSVMSGPSSTPATWSNNLPPDAANRYHVLSGHTVTVDAPFAGYELRAKNGGIINFDSAGRGV